MLLLFFVSFALAEYSVIYGVRQLGDVMVYTMLDRCVHFVDEYVKLVKKDEHTMTKYRSSTDCDTLEYEKDITVNAYDDGYSLYTSNYVLLEYDFGAPVANTDTLLQITAYKRYGCTEMHNGDYRDIKFDGYLVQYNHGTDTTICGSMAHDFTYRYAPGMPLQRTVWVVLPETSGVWPLAVALVALFLTLLI